jgi:phage terminase large subunit
MKSEFHFAYSNGSRLAYIGMDGEEDRKKLRSFGIDGGIDIAWIEEAVETEYEDYNEIRGRMRGKAAPWRQLILTTNPDSDLHWINVHLIEGGKAKVFYSQSADNPFNPDDYNATLAEMTGVRALRMREGKWARATGLVYDMWLDDYGKAPAGQEQGNVTDQAEYVPDRNLTFFWGVDDGYVGTVDQLTGHFTGNSHPRVFLLGQVRADGRVSIFAEHYAIKRLSEEHISEVQTLAKENSWPDEPDFAVVDKSAAELKGRLNSKGIATRNGAPTVEESIKMLQNLIAPDSNGVRQLMIHPRCKHLRSEMNAYRRDPLTEKPVKEFDHGPDVCRYLAYSLRAFGVN